ncbi:MAG: hypothetical protein IJR50_06605 [Treponema sp.]|nr:hypothetical protein [Treponema sp.]
MSLKRIAVLFLALFGFCFAACKQVVEVEKIVVNEKLVEVKFSDGHEAGDVLWNDGTWSAKADVASLTAFPEGKKPIGVLAFEKSGTPYCVGLAIRTSKSWAADGSTGYNTNISALQGNVFGEGETDGSKSLAALKAACSDYRETNYPAWYWAENFDSNGVQYKSASLKGKWYIPSVYELGKVYISRKAINESLGKLNNLDSSSCTVDSLGFKQYWSSSQYVSPDNYAWDIDFVSGTVYTNEKSYFKNSVLVVQAFTY